MGLNYNVTREILRSQEVSGPTFSIATIGRLQQFLLPKQCASLCHEFGLDPSSAWCEQPFGRYGEGLLTAIGANEVVSVDASDYEGATIVHDMNSPIPAELRERFDVVVDGGTMEHVFNAPAALANMMRMVRIGGSLITWSPANNLCGHGFYQLSPEFFFSALDKEQGFALRQVALVECRFPSVSLATTRRSFLVRSPREAGRRIEVMSKRPLMLLTRSVKVAHLDSPFRQIPQQSDYVSAWLGGPTSGSWASPLVGRLREVMLSNLRRSGRGQATVRWFQGVNELRRNSLRNKRFFTPE